MGSIEETTSYIFKICLLGQGSVGKTCIVKRFCFNTFDTNTKLTIGINFYSHQLPIIIKGKKSKIILSIWDFGGQEQFKDLFHYYIGGANGIFTVFNLDNLQTLIGLDWWYKKLVEYNQNDTPRILVGAKKDLAKKSKKTVSNELVVQQFMKRHDDESFFKTSSKNNYNIQPLFKEMIKVILEKNNFDYDKFV